MMGWRDTGMRRTAEARCVMASTLPIDSVEITPQEGADVAGVIAPPPLIYAAAFGVGLLLDRLASLNRVRIPGLRALGVATLLGGLGLSAWGFQTMHRAGTPVIPTHPTKVIVTDGPFRYTRNPG